MNMNHAAITALSSKCPSWHSRIALASLRFTLCAGVLVALGKQTAAALDRAPDVMWAREGGGPMTWRNVTDQAKSAAADGNGSVYVTGSFSHYAKFGGLEMISTANFTDFFLVKYDASGNALWERHGTSSGDDSNGSYPSYGASVVAAPDGGVVVAGYCRAPATIDGQAVDSGGPYANFPDLNPSLLASDCYFVGKYASNGNRLWLHFAKLFVEGASRASPKIALDSSGNVYLLGAFQILVDFEGQTLTNSAGVSSAGLQPQNGFVAKYSSSGQWQWAKQTSMGQGAIYPNDWPNSFDTDAEGNFYIGGNFFPRSNDATLTFGSVGLTNSTDSFVAYAVKLDATGSGLWIKTLSSGSAAFGGFPITVKADATGNVYSGYVHPRSVGWSLVKFDAFGRQLWSRDVPVSMDCFTLDPAGNAVAAGSFDLASWKSFTGQSLSNLCGSCRNLGLVAFTPSGALRWAHRFADDPSLNRSASVNSIAQESATSWYMAGSFNELYVLDGIRLQTPWPTDGRIEFQTFVARFAFPGTNALPAVTVQPVNITAFETRAIELQVVAASISPLSYQWRFNGLPISYAKTNTLTFTNATLDVSGNYSVVVSNSNGPVESATVAVTILPLSKLGEALNATNLQWRLGNSVGGSKSWELDTNVTHDGVMSARTAWLDIGEDCWMETTVQGPGILSCWLKVSTDLDQPLLKFLLDGVLQYSISGEGTGDGTLEEGHWQLVTLNIGSGTHTARWWWYEQFGPDELNLGWVDQVSLQSLSNAPTRITDATRLSDGKFQFTIDGPAGAAYGIEACSDLKSWLPIGQFVATNGVVTFTHQTAANFPVHYYRAVVVLPP